MRFFATDTITFATTLVANSGDFERFRQAMDPHCKNPEDPLDHDLNPLMKGLLIFLVMFLLVIPLVIILCSYGYIFIVSYKQRKNIRGQNNIPGMATAIKHEMKGASTLAIVVVVCPLSIIPLLVVAGLRFFGELPECGQSKGTLMRFVGFDLATVSNAKLCAVALEAEKKGPGVLNEEFATRKNYLKGVEHFPDFRTSSGNRDFRNKNGKKDLYISFHYIYTKFTFIQK